MLWYSEKQESGFLHGCEGRRGPQEESFSKKGVMEMFDARTWVLNLEPDCPSPEDLDQLSLPTMCNYCPQASLLHRASLPLLCPCPWAVSLLITVPRNPWPTYCHCLQVPRLLPGVSVPLGSYIKFSSSILAPPGIPAPPMSLPLCWGTQSVRIYPAWSGSCQFENKCLAGVFACLARVLCWNMSATSILCYVTVFLCPKHASTGICVPVLLVTNVCCRYAGTHLVLGGDLLCLGWVCV